MSRPRIVTIGVYGYSEQGFFAALQQAEIDLFCDIRRRRGVRGSQYAFANSQQLQAKLVELDIAYRHILALAPSDALRYRQEAIDQAARTPRRQRQALDPAFIAGYEQECLAEFSPQAFLDELPAGVQAVAFFCVERAPEACQRSLVAAKFAEMGLEVEHIQ